MNTQQVTEHTEATTDEYPEAKRIEQITNDCGEGKEGASPSTLVMVTADAASACTGDGCAVTLRKG